MIQEALDLPLHERDALCAQAGYRLITKLLMFFDNQKIEGAAAVTEGLLDREMRCLLSEGWKYLDEAAAQQFVAARGVPATVN